MDIDWKGIRALDGSQDAGFEELCAQLARAESPSNATFERKGSPDAGVECYCVLPDGSEWGWQAKYFFGLRSSQWSQIDRSIETALEKHPKLARYFVCAPMNRPDSRRSGQTSSMARWRAGVAKWQGWARARGMDVEFVWWGASELIERLSKPEHAGRLQFWFDVTAFDGSWFQERLKEAIVAAGPRYTPELHIDLPIAQELEQFAHSEVSVNSIKSLARGLRQEFRHIGILKPQDRQVREGLEELDQVGKSVLEKFSALRYTPTGELLVQDILNAIDDADLKTGTLFELLSQRERDSVHQEFTVILRIKHELRAAHQHLIEAQRLADNSLMVVTGAYGTGKTHLLCDFAKNRVDAGVPVVLLMGQRFTESTDPWTQALNTLGLQGRSPDEFVGALEAAAQASHSRGLVIIDALNEGRGSDIWPHHLPSFLAILEKSPWIGVVLSVRSPLEQAFIPEEVQSKAAVIVHHSFGGQEYDATRTFFSHHGLEFPSAPILHPEFRNALFLKTLCRGLQQKGETRLPRGLSGITSTFEFYLDAINTSLAKRLDYNPENKLVRQALTAFCQALTDAGKRWLPSGLAQEIVDDALPSRSFSKSLYHGLVTEGILLEHGGLASDGTYQRVTSMTYERFADHLIADLLLQTHLDEDDPKAAFGEGGGLAFLDDEETDVELGLIEAMCIQVPERAGCELYTVAPRLLERPYSADAFLESVVWRNTDAFSEETRTVWKYVEEKYRSADSIDTLLTVAALPSHPFNAEFLDQRLRKEAMADRDAWWSTYLHRAWGSQASVDRIVDWAESLSPEVYLQDSVVDLCAITLGWMLTTPNRFLRDRATKGLVSLLTGRYESTSRLIDRFSDVDDPYVTERIYAVAYGVAMRSHDASKVGTLATLVYEKVFAAGAPPAHVLLRDYARGVIEHAIHLGASLDLDAQMVRPPYRSDWPNIPSEKATEAEWYGSHDEGAKRRIRASVTADDFSIYVIGHASNWLSATKDEEAWLPPDKRLAAFLPNLNDAERLAWEAFDKARQDRSTAIADALLQRIINQADGSQVRISPECAENQDVPAEYDQAVDRSRNDLIATLTDEHRAECESILGDQDESGRSAEPRFDTEVIRRYILWRVLELGWTSERFAHFDESLGYQGRHAAKPERIGKKYQWIAYHEILAYMSDHYQYQERFAVGNAAQGYEGPWQEHLRDIDPSCTIRATPGGSAFAPHTAAWWGETVYDAWGEDTSHADWLALQDIPNIEGLLRIEDDAGTSWINVNGNFLWRQSEAADVEPFDIDRREIWLTATGVFVDSKDVDDFLEWSKEAQFWGKQHPGPSEVYRVFVGEHGWSPAFRQCLVEDWIEPHEYNYPVKVQACSVRYVLEAGGFDCSLDDTYALQLPQYQFLRHLDLKWSGRGSDHLDKHERLAAFDPTARTSGPNALLLREDLLQQYLGDEGLDLCWIVLAEKWVIPKGHGHRVGYGRLRASGVWRYTTEGLQGSYKFVSEPGFGEPPE